MGSTKKKDRQEDKKAAARVTFYWAQNIIRVHDGAMTLKDIYQAMNKERREHDYARQWHPPICVKAIGPTEIRSASDLLELREGWEIQGNVIK